MSKPEIVTSGYFKVYSEKVKDPITGVMKWASMVKAVGSSMFVVEKEVEVVLGEVKDFDKDQLNALLTETWERIVPEAEQKVREELKEVFGYDE